MAGHSKWANIQHRKGAQDAKRGKLFTKLIREITVAARLGGSDPGSNPRLRAAIETGLNANMSKDKIEQATKKGAGELDGQDYVEIRYEGYGPDGIAIIVDCMTDNKNRTVAEVRHAFSKAGGNLGTEGSVAFMFEKQGIISFDASYDEDNIMEAALDAGAEDVISHDDGSIDVITTPELFGTVKDTLDATKMTSQHAEVTMRAENETTLNAKSAEKVLRLIDILEDLDDVQQVYTNADIPDSVFG